MHSAESAAHDQAMQNLHEDAERIFAYLERHVPPNDMALFRYLMGVQVKSRNTAQMSLGWGGEKHLG